MAHPATPAWNRRQALALAAYMAPTQPRRYSIHTLELWIGEALADYRCTPFARRGKVRAECRRLCAMLRGARALEALWWRGVTDPYAADAAVLAREIGRAA